MKIATSSPRIGALAASAALFLAPIAAGAGFGGSQNMAVYWGQNSYGQGTGNLAQQHLVSYCANTNLDIIPMSFVTRITTGKGGVPVINFANSGDTCSVFNNTDLWSCPSYADEIKTCQQTYNKTILLSIGGATYNEAGFKTQAGAISAANLMWATFGPQSAATNTTLRPFYDAVIDGFDIDIESTNTFFRAFALRLRALMNADPSKPYYLTAAPQCPYPDYMNPMFNDPKGGVPFDALFIQFYNNPSCGLQAYNTSTGTTQANFNFKTWNDWATQKSANPNVKLFLGVPGAVGAASAGSYKTPAGLKPIVAYCKTFSNFGGVSVWDISQAYSNKPFLANVKGLLTTATKRRRGPMRRWFGDL